METRPLGIVFDLDGVLLDSEPLHRAAVREVLEPHGVRFTDVEYASALMGLDDRTLIPRAYAMRGRAIGREEVERLAESKTKALARILERGVEPLPGALELLREAAARLPVGLCSGSRRIEIDRILRALGPDVCGLFTVTVSADDVSRSKPDPEGYSRAVDALERDPGECLAIEDTPTGIRAALAAGLFVLGVDTLGAPERLARADHIEASLAGVRLEDLRRWMARPHRPR